MRTPIKNFVRFFSVAVLLLILCGCPPVVRVPDVIGMSRIQAYPEILRFGLVIGTETEVADPAIGYGIVVSQRPAAGTFVLAGTAVDLVVTSSPSPKGGSTPIEKRPGTTRE